MKRFFIFTLILLSGYFSAQAKTKKFGTWVEFEFSKKFLKDFKFSVIPEFRFQDDFTLDEYIFEGKLGYQPFKHLDFAGSYRMYTNIRKKGNEISHKLVFDIKADKDLGRFNASLRARFTNDSDDNDIDQQPANYFRPRLKIEYDIPKNKINPYVSYEIYHNLSENKFHKNRFSIGATRKLGKQHEIGLYYRLQSYFEANKESIHIAGIDYGFKF